MSTSDIFHFVQIDDRTGTAGQPTAAQLKEARDEGYEAVISLVPATQENALADEGKIVRGLGMEYHYIPVIWTNPRVEDFKAFTAVMKNLGDRKTLIHCAANFRVTAFYSTYAIKHLGWSREKADALVDKMWNANPEHFKMDATWRTFIDEIRR